MKLKFLGHSSFLIEHKEFKILIDPFIKGNKSVNYDEEDLKGITHILVSHGHGDHIGDTETLAKENNCLVICNFEIGQYLLNKGLKVHTMHVGGRYRFDFGRLKMTPALHGSGIYNGEFFICGGSPCGFLIEIGNEKIYHAGDTGLTMDMKLLEYDKVDIALLPIGGNYTMDMEDALRAIEFIRPRIVVPMHYNTFPVIQADPTEMCKKVNCCQFIILNPGESLNE